MAFASALGIQDNKGVLIAAKLLSLFLVVISLILLFMKYFNGEYTILLLLLVLYLSSSVQISLSELASKFGTQADKYMLLHSSLLQSWAGVLGIWFLNYDLDFYDKIFGVYILSVVIGFVLIASVS